MDAKRHAVEKSKTFFELSKNVKTLSGEYIMHKITELEFNLNTKGLSIPIPWTHDDALMSK
jgi:hypothetical protein